MKSLIQLLTLTLFAFACVNALDDGIDERVLEPTLEFIPESLVKRNYFETLKNSQTQFKDEIEALGETFMMFYFEDSHKSKVLIPKFDRSATLNVYPSITYVAVDCKRAKHFCRMMDITGVPSLYYVRSYDEIYKYTNHYLHKHFQVFFRGNYQDQESFGVKDLMNKQGQERKRDQQMYVDFKDTIPHINNESFDKLAQRNQLIMFYSKSSSISKDLIPMFTDLYENSQNARNTTFAAIDQQDNSDSITKVLRTRSSPSLIYVTDSGNYVKYSGAYKKESIENFFNEGYMTQALNKKAVGGDINDVLKQISEAEEQANAGGKRQIEQEEKAEAQKKAYQRILEQEEKRNQKKAEQQQVNGSEDL